MLMFNNRPGKRARAAAATIIAYTGAMRKSICFSYATRRAIRDGIPAAWPRVRSTAVLFATAGLAVLPGACAVHEPRELNPASRAAVFAARTLRDPELLNFVRESYLKLKNPRVASDNEIIESIQRLDLQTLRILAIHEHAEMAEADANIRARDAAITTAGARPNPTLNFAPEYSWNAPSGDSPWVLPVSVDFTIETGGKRDARIAVAKIDRAIAEFDKYIAQWKVASGVRMAVAKWNANYQYLENTHKEIEARERILQIIEKRISAGEAGRIAASEQEIAIATLRAREGRETREWNGARAELAKSLALPVSALASIQPFKAIPDGQERLIALRFPDSMFINENGTQPAARLDVCKALLEYQQTDAMLRLEISRQYPDIHLGPGYQYDQGQNKFTLGFSLDLPFFNKNEGAIAEALARRDAAAARFDIIQFAAIGELETAEARWRASSNISRTLHIAELNIQLRAERLQRLVAGGEADALDTALLDLERIQFERMRMDAELEYQQSLDALEAAQQRTVNE